LEQLGTQKENEPRTTSNTKRKLEPDGLPNTAEFRTAKKKRQQQQRLEQQNDRSEGRVPRLHQLTQTVSFA
jgi:hypothetical protein